MDLISGRSKMAPVKLTATRESSQMTLNMQKKKSKNHEKCMKEVIATAQDIKYARFLAGNDKVIRDKALKSLKKWFEQRVRSSIPFNEADLMLLWKGLFYSMWMSDKPLVQEECAERIASFIHVLDTQGGLLFFKTGIKTLSNEWFGIDQWRTDKFLMFVRRLLRQALFLLKKNNWELKLIKQFDDVLAATVLSGSHTAPLSLVLHFSDIYMPELAKVSEGELDPNMLNAFLAPFIGCLAKSSDMRLINAIAENVFRYLIRQSNEGLEYDEKFHAWKKMGFPGGNINTLQRASEEDFDDDEDDEDDDDAAEDDEDIEELGSEEDDDVELDDDEELDDEEELDEEEEEELTGMDPRAGRVNVVLPQIRFSSKNLEKLMTEYKFKAANTKARGVLTKLIQQFVDLHTGQYPLGIKKVEVYKEKSLASAIKQSANRLVKFENKLYGRDKKELKRKISDSSENSETGDQEVPTMKKPKLAQEIVAEKQPQKVTKHVVNAKQKQKTKTEVNGKQTKVEANGKQKNEQHLEVQLRKTMETTRKLQMEKKQLVQKNLLLKNKKRKLEKEVKTTKKELLGLNANEAFVRNSGTWFVHEPEDDSDYEVNSPVKPNVVASPPKTSPSVNKSPKSTKQNSPIESILKTSTPTKTTTTTSLFPAGDWDADLLDGEVEFFVPSKKYQAKRQSVGVTMSKPMEKSKSMIKGKGRRSLGSSLGSQLSASKKVKIDLRLNKSQEVYEHQAQIMSSPGIPFDANRKPTRPVIKPNAVSSPINPFYRRKFGLK